jgi:hypothetical protein
MMYAEVVYNLQHVERILALSSFYTCSGPLVRWVRHAAARSSRPTPALRRERAALRWERHLAARLVHLCRMFEDFSDSRTTCSSTALELHTDGDLMAVAASAQRSVSSAFLTL